jgi:SOS-response transcriptional repressor LexA
MKNKEAVDQWLKMCHDEWLHKYDTHDHLRPATKDLVTKLRSSYTKTKKNQEAVWECIKRLESRNDRFHHEGPSSAEQEAAEVKLECAMAAYAMGDFLRAIQMLKDSAQKYHTDYHCEAVTKWMLGCLEWQNNQADEAIYRWESCKKLFGDGERKGPTNEFKEWYSEWGKRMEDIIHSAVENDKLLPPSYSSSSGGPIKKHSIRSFPVLGQIPAGVPASVVKPSGAIFFEDVILNNVPYRIVSLKKGEKVINLPDGKDYYALKVSGNSMNKAEPEPIMDGNYVLIHAQNVADHGDIVAAEIVGVDYLATLKRYAIEGGKPVLKPESNDPTFKPIALRLSDCIRGVALAVLKRLED